MGNRQFVVTGITGLGNRGVEALLIPTVEQLRDRLGADVTVLTRTPEYDRQRLSLPGVTCLRDEFFFRGAPRLSLQRRLRRRVGGLIGRSARPSVVERAVQEASMVIAAGGDVFGSDYGDMPLHLLPLQLAQRHGVPVIFLAQSIGPFRTTSEAETWTAVAQRSPLVTVRESRTYEYVTRDLGIPASQVHLTADPAFLLEPCPPDTARRLAAYYGINQQRPAVALSISSGIGQFAGVDRTVHVEAWRRLVDLLLEETDAQLVLIPHVQTTDTDDRVVPTEMLRSFQYEPRMRLIGGDHTAAELKGLVGQCEMVVAERMHAAIAGLSSGVCTIVIAYSVKAEGTMADLFGPDAADEGLVIRIDDFAHDPTRAAGIRDVWKRRAAIGDRLRQALPAMAARAQQTFDLIETSQRRSADRGIG